MARKAGIEWKAVGASLDDLARTMRRVPAGTPGAFAYASSGVLQQAGVVMLARYITPQNHAEMKRARIVYTAPPDGTHGPMVRTQKRNERGQFVQQMEERKLFIKGKFVSRTGNMRGVADELSRAKPSEAVSVTLADGTNPRKGGTGDIEAGIGSDGTGFLSISGGYRAAELGVKGKANGVRGWWRALRSVQGRYATLLRKKYPDLLRVKVSS
jgi:hypothetical protein